MARITAITNQKGGVGKTTTAAALLSGLNSRGYKTLAVDLDAQGNLSYIAGASGGRSIYAALKGSPARDQIERTAQGDIIPSSRALLGADIEFTQTGREYVLKNALNAIAADYTHIIIDCPPQLGILTVNALTAANDLIVPMRADILSVQGLYQLAETINTVRKYCNAGLNVAGLLITQYTARTILARDLAAVIQEQAAQLQTQCYKTTIRDAIAVKEAQTLRQSLEAAHPRAKVTQDYNAFIAEYLSQEGKR